jgi:hypothetical protein
MLDRVMLFSTEYAALRERVGDAQTSGQFADTRLVRWVRRGDQVHLELVPFDVRAAGEPGRTRTVEHTSPGLLIRSFNVLSGGADGAPVIDVTSLFFLDLPTGFAQEFRRQFRMVHADRQRSYIESVKIFPQNIEVRFSQTWTANPEDLAKQSESGDGSVPPSMGFLFQASMLLLPEQPMQGRYADPRVGYFSEPFNEYGTRRAGAARRAFIQRYRLEKKDPNAEVSEPIKPIVFYIGREVPDRWRPYIKRGVEDWQVVFEKAGFRNAIIAKDAPTEQEDTTWDPEDARYSAIRWVRGQSAMGWGLADPRSGEVISSHATFWHSVLNDLENWYFAQVAPLDSRAQRLPLPDEVMGQLVRYVVSHEVGHALGLRHNFKAHSAYSVAQLRSQQWTERWGTSASIMSYARFNYVAQPDDHAYLLPRFGPYDYFAVEWGYKPLPGLSSDQQWEAYRQQVKQTNLSAQARTTAEEIRKHLDQLGQAHRPLLLPVDGSFCNRRFFREPLDRTYILARARKDARLCLPAPAGSRRRYDPTLFTPEAVRQDDSIPWHKTTVFFGGKRRKIRFKVVNNVLWRRGAGLRPLRLIVLAPTPYRLSPNAKTAYRDPAYLLTDDLASSLTSLLQSYIDRWQIEVNHREIKSYFGAGEAQVRATLSVPRVPAFVVSCYSLLHLAGILEFGPSRTDHFTPLPKWRRPSSRPSIADLLRLLRTELNETRDSTFSIQIPVDKLVLSPAA